MSTPRAIILQALKVTGVTGVGQVANDDDVNDAYFALQAMAGQWARKRWLSFRLADVAFLTTGAASYSIGVGGDISTIRPDRIEAAFARLRPTAAYPTDYSLQVLDDREDWNRVRSKAARGVPSAVFYDATWPLGTVYVWPVPMAGQAYEIHLSVKSGVGGFAGLDADTGLPPEYDGALLYNLAVRLRPAYQLGPDPSLTALALDALNTIRKTNTQLPRLRMPAGLPGVRGVENWMLGMQGPGGDPPLTQPGFRLGISLLDGPDVLQ